MKLYLIKNKLILGITDKAELKQLSNESERNLASLLQYYVWIDEASYCQPFWLPSLSDNLYNL